MRTLWMLALSMLLAAAHAAGGTSAAAASITKITLERGCFGCTTGSALVLGRDGSAVHTVTGNERSGTADIARRGVIAARDFGTLARLVVTQGFFELQDSYETPGLRDGPWTTITVSRGDRDKQVFRREDAGPPALKSIAAAIEAAAAGIEFRP